MGVGHGGASAGHQVTAEPIHRKQWRNGAKGRKCFSLKGTHSYTFRMQPILSISLADEAATRRLGQRLWPFLASGDVVALGGDLGAGKTTFARGLIQAAMHSNVPVPSPTFTLVQTYDPPEGPRIWHFDLYRLAGPDELEELGWEEALTDGVVLVEWPERAVGSLPDEALWLVIEETGDARTAKFSTGCDDWADRLSKGFRA
jgi:tRNA threonylcarbamoyl adenosine modification protein YjeE